MALLRAAAAACLSALVLSACGYDTGDDLEPVIAQAAPADARAVSCAGSDGLIDLASRDCTYLAPGAGATVADKVARALRKNGFEVSCARPGSLAGLRADVRVIAEIIQYGSIAGSGGVTNVYDAGYRPAGSRPIPEGFVALKLSASRQSDSSASFWQGEVAAGGRCDRALPRPNRIAQCATWWNGAVGVTTREAARRLRLGPAVHVSRTEKPAVSSCAYTLRSRDGFAHVTARFDNGQWVWPRIRAVELQGHLHPNARLVDSGFLVAP